MNVVHHSGDKVRVALGDGASCALHHLIEALPRVVKVCRSVASVKDVVFEVILCVGESVDKVVRNGGIVVEVASGVHGSKDVAEVGVGGHWSVLSVGVLLTT